MSETGWRQSFLRLIGTGLETLSETCPRGYLVIATTLALAGYGGLLLFPWLLLVGVSAGYAAVTGQPAVVWSHLLVWSAVTAGSALVTCRIARFRPALPAGCVLDRNKAPALFDLVGELVRHYRRPVIDRIVISGAFELELVKTPLWALPVWSVNTLIIGLPMIRSLSPAQFRCVLARRLGQFSKRYNPLQNWLTQLRRIWPQYCTATGASFTGLQPVRWLFSIYAPLYNVVSLPAARLDELAADSYAMEVCSGEEVLDAITVETVSRCYLEEKYWPVYRRLSAPVREAMPKPHAGMASALRAGLKEDRGEQWLMQALDQEPRWDDPMPSLARRMDNIGYLDTQIGDMATVSAAVVYLGPVVEALDEALGQAVPDGISQVSRRYPFKLEPHKLMAALKRLSRRGRARNDASTADTHYQISSLQ